MSKNVFWESGTSYLVPLLVGQESTSDAGELVAEGVFEVEVAVGIEVEVFGNPVEDVAGLGSALDLCFCAPSPTPTPTPTATATTNTTAPSTSQNIRGLSPQIVAVGMGAGGATWSYRKS